MGGERVRGEGQRGGRVMEDYLCICQFVPLWFEVIDDSIDRSFQC